ncbi:NAD(P)/FAD-dependent oxidoreductase [Maridesulfovibrio bastinii]|uniref:NAD(P)/FAD-dependent oxidoreductase n=1 Tax=Maridesulfovibrio bastinii TaxID=47157 RepID=UPI00040A1613|nr:NAD(P)/FAD-dependent oxidoreductase [Maridesulfovibrio bastinii]
MSDTNYDVVILGTGPAGLQAAIHSARKNVSVLILGKQDKSSLKWAHIENFCCMSSIEGSKILKTGMEQAQTFGAVFLDEDVLKIAAPDQAESEGATFTITTESKEIKAKSVIIATGTTRNKLGVPGEKEYLGKGVSYCVDCDGNFFRNEPVAVVGDESAAAGGALHMAALTENVHLICKEINFSNDLLEKLTDKNVKIHKNVEVTEIEGNGQVNGLVLDNGVTLPVNGVFIELGAKGVMSLAGTLGVALDDSMKFIQTDKQQKTNVPGIFAAGDICGPPLQMAKAIGEGCVAGINSANYAKKH